jgi:hypothetical protein
MSYKNNVKKFTKILDNHYKIYKIYKHHNNYDLKNDCRAKEAFLKTNNLFLDINGGGD